MSNQPHVADTEYHCPLCTSNATRFYHQDQRREYHQCSVCSLVFVPVEFHLSPQEEKAEYDLHVNSPTDHGYRQFLNRLYQPMQQRLKENSVGLDFGCGPGPTLSVMFEEAGHSVRLYDPFYAPDPSVFNRRYDFITASEVVEHLRQPRLEFERLWSLLLPGGVFGVMTKRVRNRAAFTRWHYIHDRTHIAFFSAATFEWLSHYLGARLEVIGDDVVILTK